MTLINKYNNAYHRTIKMKPFDIKPSTYIDFSKEIKHAYLKLVMLLQYQYIKIFLQEVTLQIGLKEFS